MEAFLSFNKSDPGHPSSIGGHCSKENSLIWNFVYKKVLLLEFKEVLQQVIICATITFCGERKRKKKRELSQKYPDLCASCDPNTKNTGYYSTYNATQ